MVRKTLLYFALTMWYLLLANTTFAYIREDSLRGGNGNGRNWWNVQHYDLHVIFDTAAKSISGSNIIRLKVGNTPDDSMQIDLQEPMVLDSVVWQGQRLNITKEGKNVWWVTYPFGSWAAGSTQEVYAYYHGQPRIARNAPWEGGFIWTKDDNGRLWAAVACQGLGASAWWPCKDIQSDEPDKGIDMHYVAPKGLSCIGNGRFLQKNPFGDDREQWHWRVSSPINTYNVTFYLGDYVHWEDTLKGEGGMLNIGYYALRNNEAKARKQFEEVKAMIPCFEYWMGQYPFYADGYNIVEAPFLGMEHQSAIAYGNEYKKGYKGSDRSHSGVGELFDYIIIHESGHEWFGNNITAADIADNWIHEGFTTYTETLYIQCAFGKDKAFKFVRGEWENIRNDRPIVGDYGVNDDGSSDKYDKGAAIVHMIRMMMNNDAAFRDLLRGLNSKYFHQTVTGKEIEAYIQKTTGLALQPFFDQYLRTTMIPQFEWYIKDKQLHYRFTSVVPGFSLPLEVSKRKNKAKITVTGDWQSINWKKGGYNVNISEDFLVRMKN